jgi:hypothetical protein
MLMQDMLTGYVHEVPDSQLYGYDDVVYDGLGNPVGIAPLLMAALPAIMPMLTNILNPARSNGPAPPAALPTLPSPPPATPPPPATLQPPEPAPIPSAAPPYVMQPPEPPYEPPMPPYPMGPMRPMPDGFPMPPNLQPGPGYPFATRRYRLRLRRRRSNVSSRSLYR